MRTERHLLLFTFTRMSDVVAKGNISYTRHYELYFDRVTIAYLIGHQPRERREGKIELISLGVAGEPRFLTLLLMPWRLWRLASRIKPTSYLTADAFYSWWTGLLLRGLLGARVVLVPVAMPAVVYSSSGRAITGLPYWIERWMTKLCFAAAARVMTTQNAESYVKWLRSEPVASRKLRVVSALVEEYPPPSFYEALAAQRIDRSKLHRPPNLLYVGRMHREKLAIELIDMMVELSRRGVPARLILAGDGEDRATMERRAAELGVADDIDWLGFVPTASLPEVYGRADIFVSTLTGTALREAGLMGLPVVAYRVDWVQDLLQDGDDALLVPPNRPDLLAEKVAQLIKDDSLRVRLSVAFRAKAGRMWCLENIRAGLAEAFGDDAPASVATPAVLP